MKPGRLTFVFCWAAMLTGFSLTPARVPLATTTPNIEPAEASSWYFAASGDSRDCGDLIMPKIAKSIATRRQQLPIRFYWHLGDFRALFRIDCDMAKRMNPARKCALESTTNELKPTPDYLKAAWPDFIERQVKPFEQARIPIYLGIGNHETIERAPEEFRAAFQKWFRLPRTALARHKELWSAATRAALFTTSGPGHEHKLPTGGKVGGCFRSLSSVVFQFSEL